MGSHVACGCGSCHMGSHVACGCGSCHMGHSSRYFPIHTTLFFIVLQLLSRPYLGSTFRIHIVSPTSSFQVSSIPLSLILAPSDGCQSPSKNASVICNDEPPALVRANRLLRLLRLSKLLRMIKFSKYLAFLADLTHFNPGATYYYELRTTCYY